MPRLSVLMCVHNGESHLRQSVESMLTQTFTDFEFAIVDDGSTDATATILDGYTDSRIVRLRNETNIGLTKSLNRGLAAARGAYVARQDADDWSLPVRLERQVCYLDEHPEVGLVVSGWLEEWDAGTSIEKPFLLDGIQLRWRLHFYNPIAHSSVMFRRRLLDNVGGYSDALPCTQDYDLWCRISKATGVGVVPTPLVVLRRGGAGSVTGQKAELQERIAQQTGMAMIRHTMGMPDLLEDRVRWLIAAGKGHFDRIPPEQVGRVADDVRSLWHRFANDCTIRGERSGTVLHEVKSLFRGLLRYYLRCDKPLWSPTTVAKLLASMIHIAI